MESAPEGFRNVEANKAFTMGGVEYKPGDPVDVSRLSDLKVSQFLNQRLIRPARPRTSESPG